MTPERPTDESLRALFDAACSDTITDEQFERLETALMASEDARREYLRYFTLTGELRYLVSMAHADEAARERTGLESGALDRHIETPVEPLGHTPSDVSFPVGILQSIAGGLSQDWTRAYLLAAAALGLFLVVASFVHVSHSVSVDRAGQLAEGSPRTSAVEFVGRIIGMADCRWADPSTAAYAGASVPLGRKYALAAGLMEISYDSGAKVILQGPCTYEVESASGGYLSLGKLTARVGNNSEFGIRNSEKGVHDNSEFRIPNSELFFVRTPTAIVADLGTEFGVEVEQDGNTISHVFRGSVKIQVVGGNGLPPPSGRGAGGEGVDHTIILGENESARVEKRDGKPSIARRAAGDGSQFVLSMPPPKSVRQSEAYAELVLSLNPVVYYRMERPAKKGTGPIGAKHPEGRSGQLDLSPSALVFDSAPGGHHGELRLGNEFGSPYVPGRFGNALWLRGPAVCDRVVVPDYPKATEDRLTVSAWVLATGRPGWAMIASNWSRSEEGRGERGQFHFGLYRRDGDICVYATQRGGQRVRIREGASQPFPLYVWQHVALVADGTTLHLYRNGEEVASTPCAGILPQPPVLGLGIGCKFNNQAGTDAALDIPGYNFWQGRIDELAIFNQALPPETIQALYLGRQLPEQTEETLKNTKGGKLMHGP